MGLTIVFFVIGIIIVISLIRKIFSLGRDLTNNVRNMMGENDIEVDRAYDKINSYSKNGLIPAWAVRETAATLVKNYDENSAINFVRNTLQSNGIEGVDFPKKFYFAPGTSYEQLANTCKKYFGSFDFKRILSDDTNSGMTDADYETFNNLVYMWYFADDSVNEIPEAREKVRQIFSEYIEANYSNK